MVPIPACLVVIPVWASYLNITIFKQRPVNLGTQVDALVKLGTQVDAYQEIKVKPPQLEQIKCSHSLTWNYLGRQWEVRISS